MKDEMIETMDSTKKKSLLSRIPILLVIVIAVIAVVMLAVRAVRNQEGKKNVITTSTLAKIVDVSELSTFTAVYNGIAQVPEESKPEKTAYYVSYKAKVNAGLDFEKIKFDVEDKEGKDETKIIRAILPKVGITDVIVDITSMDYIFVNKKANTPTVSQEAYKACEADAQSECEQEAAIFDLAEQNAENILRALIEPFVDQMDSEYRLEIEWEG